MADDPIVDLAEYVTEALGDAVEDSVVALGELTLLVAPGKLIKVLNFLKSDQQCQFIAYVDGAGVDYPARAKRFDMVHHLLSPRQNLRIRVKTQTDEETPIPSATEVFTGAEWYEREAYDLFGILFTGHPDLRRLLTDYGFEGHPLRKDFPTTGFVEVRWDDTVKRVVYEPVSLRQEFRQFDFLSPWEGTEYELPGDEKAKRGTSWSGKQGTGHSA